MVISWLQQYYPKNKQKTSTHSNLTTDGRPFKEEGKKLTFELTVKCEYIFGVVLTPLA